MIFGTGFAPFTSGPMHYVYHEGKDKVVKMLEQFERQYGERFKPVAYWQQLQLTEGE